MRRVERRQGIEALRVLSAFGIVGFHAGVAGREYLYAGLIVFLMLSPFADLAFNSGRVRRVGGLARTCLGPWLVWLAIYGALNLAVGKPLLAVPNPIGGLLYGTSAHLWFLPAIFVVLSFLNLTKPRLGANLVYNVCASGAVALFATAPIWLPLSAAWGSPYQQWMHALPAILIGIMIGAGESTHRHRAWTTLALFACAGLTLGAPMPGFTIPYCTGIVIFCGVIWSPHVTLPFDIDIRSVAACMMGVYLSHIVWLAVFSRLTGAGTYATAALAFVAAFLMTWFARNLPMAFYLTGYRAPAGAPPLRGGGVGFA